MDTPDKELIRAAAVNRALSLVGTGTYVLGTGNYVPQNGGDDTKPWTRHHKSGLVGCDCWGLVASAFRQRRHRPGYNKGGSVSDDINVDSAVEDARGFGGQKPREELWRLLRADEHPIAGDLAVWPSIRVGGARLRIGHVGILIASTTYWSGKFADLQLVQCSSQRPFGAAVRVSSAAAWDNRNVSKIPPFKRESWRSLLLRLV